MEHFCFDPLANLIRMTSLEYLEVVFGPVPHKRLGELTIRILNTRLLRSRIESLSP